MRFNHFYRAIIFRLSCLVISAGLLVFFHFKLNNLALTFLAAFVVIILFFNTIAYFNNINRWIAFFLLGIENEDTSLKIPTKTGNKAIDEVFEGMNRLNELFKHTKMEINTQEQYYRSIMNQSATGLFSVNGQGRISITNPAAEKLTGIIPYHHVGSLARVNEALPRFIMESDEQLASSVIFENDKAQKLLFKLSCIKTTKETIRLIAVSDITKELDNREVEAWIKLARTLSHEIMNNITPITTLSKVIGGYYTKEGKNLNVEELEQKIIDNTVKGLEVIEERSTGLMKFVENYRKFTKLPEPQFKTIDLVRFIENNLMVCSGFDYFNMVKIQTRIESGMVCTSDENLLSQVFINLMKNAIEALHYHNENEPNPYILVNADGNGSAVSLSITNNGPGIPPELREQIFVPFFTTKEEGSGIGLSLSKQLMLKMGGDLNLKPHTNLTTFVVSF
jgi:two-component system, NtrC family, nitrogen regulation sensor histidine kinase NtrY